MRARPRTKFVLKKKNRRCSKCGAPLNSQRIRCRRCHEPQTKPKK